MVKERKLLLTYSDLTFLESYTNSAMWQFGQVSDADIQPNYPMWFINPKDAFQHHQEGVDIIERICDFAGISRTIRIMIAGNTYGQDGDAHCDWDSEMQRTCVVYLNKFWDPRWGGETIIYKREPWMEVEHLSVFEPGKAIAFDSWLPHLGKAPNRRCPDLRCVLAVQGWI